MTRFATIALVALAGCAPSTATSSSAPPAAPLPEHTTTILSAGPGGAGFMVTAYHNGTTPVYDLTGTPDAIWSVLPAVYDDLRIRMGTSDPASRTYGNTSVVAGRSLAGKPLSTFLNCGSDAFGVPVADRNRINLSVLTTLTPGDNGKTHVETRVSATASNPAVSGAAAACATTGALEEEIARRIHGRLLIAAAARQ